MRNQCYVLCCNKNSKSLKVSMWFISGGRVTYAHFRWVLPLNYKIFRLICSATKQLSAGITKLWNELTSSRRPGGVFEKRKPLRWTSLHAQKNKFAVHSSLFSWHNETNEWELSTLEWEMMMSTVRVKNRKESACLTQTRNATFLLLFFFFSFFKEPVGGLILCAHRKLSLYTWELC